MSGARAGAVPAGCLGELMHLVAGPLVAWTRCAACGWRKGRGRMVRWVDGPAPALWFCTLGCAWAYSCGTRPR